MVLCRKSLLKINIDFRLFYVIIINMKYIRRVKFGR